MYKGFKIRLYPNKKQEEIIWKHIHACRFIWNYMVEYQEKNYENSGIFLTHYDMCRLLKSLKNDGEHDWLYEICSHSLKCVCKNVYDAYIAFFDGDKGHPRFKSKKIIKPSFPCRVDRTYIYDSLYIKVPKIGKIKYKTDFNLPIKKTTNKPCNIIC